MHPHHHRRGRGLQAAGERVLGLRPDAASESRPRRSQRAGRARRSRNFATPIPASSSRWRSTPALPQIAIDRDALKRALVNLLDNAVNAAVGANPNGARPANRCAAPRWPRKAAWSRWKSRTTARASIRRAAHADFRAVLFDQQGRHRARPGDCLGHRHRPSWLRPGARQPRREEVDSCSSFLIKEQQFAKVLG